MSDFDLAWRKARRILHSSEYARMQSEWPDAFMPKEIAAMQYPWEGTRAEKRKASGSQTDIVGSIKAAIADGKLVTEVRSMQVPITKSEPDFMAAHRRRLHNRELGISDEWGLSAESVPMHSVKVGECTEKVPVVSCGAFCTWFKTQGEPPSEHIKAWFDAKGVAPGAGGTVGDTARQLRANAMESMRGVGREILEHWDDILAVHGPGADAAQVQRFLTTKRDPSEKKPTGKTIHNRLGELRRDGLIP